MSEKIPPGTESEVRKAFLWLLREETAKDPFKQLSAINVVSVLPSGKISNEARYRPLKECLLNALEQVRQNRKDTRLLFSAAHFSALFKYACQHFAQTIQQPFNFIKASRTYNPVAPDFKQHISNFLRHVREPSKLTDFTVPIIASSFLFDNYPPGAHCKCILWALYDVTTNHYLVFNPVSVFRVLYQDALYWVSNSRVITFEGSRFRILRSGFIKLMESRFYEYFRQATNQHRKPSIDIHRSNLERF